MRNLPLQSASLRHGNAPAPRAAQARPPKATPSRATRILQIVCLSLAVLGCVARAYRCYQNRVQPPSMELDWSKLQGECEAERKAAERSLDQAALDLTRARLKLSPDAHLRVEWAFLDSDLAPLPGVSKHAHACLTLAKHDQPEVKVLSLEATMSWTCGKWRLDALIPVAVAKLDGPSKGSAAEGDK